MADRKYDKTPDFSHLTEVSGEPVSPEQVARMRTRYAWASQQLGTGATLEVGCGSGNGLSLLEEGGGMIVACDITRKLLRRARRTYGNRFNLLQVDAHRLPFQDAALSNIVLFEALYYLESVPQFLRECRRVLRDRSRLLIATANPDAPSFVPSPRANRYYGVAELDGVLRDHGFDVEFFGDTPLSRTSRRQRLLHPVKRAASWFGMLPRSMAGRTFLRRLVYGPLVPLPPDLAAEPGPAPVPSRISAGRADRIHKVILCAARKNSVGGEGTL